MSSSKKNSKLCKPNALVFEVLLNKRKVALAESADLSVLSTIVSAVGKLGPKATGTKKRSEGYSLTLHVGGLIGRKNKTPDEHLSWLKKKIKVGDEIRIRIVKSNAATHSCHMAMFLAIFNG